jgi:hypothetical protein
MGLTLEFFMGDPAAIGPAIANVDFDTLDDSDIVEARADLSLHLEPQDLDTLSREAAALLRASATRSVGTNPTTEPSSSPPSGSPSSPPFRLTSPPNSPAAG